MIIKFTPAQTEQGCRYPIGCPVWIFTQDPLYDDITNACTFRQGVVASVTMDFRTKQMTYEVATGDKTCSVSEEEIGFGSGCTVSVASEENKEHGHRDSLLKGKVLLCKKAAQQILYTVQFMGRYEENIGEGRITYRKVVNDAVVNATRVSPTKLPKSSHKEYHEPNAHIDAAGAVSRLELLASRGDGSSRSLLDSSVPSSIICDGSRAEPRLSEPTVSLPTASTAEKKSDATSKDNFDTASESDISRGMTDVSPTPSKRQKVDVHKVKSDRLQGNITPSVSTPRIGSGGVLTHRLRISIPLWLQKDHRSQRDLFFRIIGDKNNPRGTNPRQVQLETNCLVRVNWDDSAEKCGLSPTPMTIDLCPFDKTSDNLPRDLLMARKKIEDIILEHYVSPFPSIRGDGSKGRLMYHIAANCAGAHRPKDSTSRAVRQRNLFEGNLCWMSLLELPFTVEKVGKKFHGHFLMKPKVIEEVKNESGCSFKLVGNDFGVPTMYCDPYVLVLGYHWTKVDQAVAILKEEIRRHPNGC